MFEVQLLEIFISSGIDIAMSAIQHLAEKISAGDVYPFVTSTAEAYWTALRSRDTSSAPDDDLADKGANHGA